MSIVPVSIILVAVLSLITTSCEACFENFLYWTKSVFVVMFEDGIFMEDGLFTLGRVISQRVRCGSGVRKRDITQPRDIISEPILFSHSEPCTSLTLCLLQNINEKEFLTSSPWQ